MKSHFLFLISCLSLLSCQDEKIVLKQKVYFEKHYVNMAWIPQSSGFLVDSAGTVNIFSWVEVAHLWYDPDSTEYVSATNMDKNLSFCQTSNSHINPDSLALYVSKIPATAGVQSPLPDM